MPKSLQQRAAEQFDRRSNLRVLFLFDPQGDYKEDIEAWDHPEIRCVEAEHPGFDLIYRIEKEWTRDRVLLYAPRSRPRDLDSYALADLLVANAELTVDEPTELADERGLRDDQRHLVRDYYRSDLRYKTRRRFLDEILDPSRLTKKTLKRGIAAYHLDLFSLAPPTDDHLLAGIFIQALDADAFESYREKCVDRGLDDMLGRLLAQRFALDRNDFSIETVEIAAHKLKYNLLTQPLETVRSDDPYYRKLGIEETMLMTQLRTLVQKWDTHTALTPGYDVVLDHLATDVQEKELLRVYGPEATFGYLTPTLRVERIRQAADLLPEQPSKSREIVQELRESGDEATVAAADTVWHTASFYKVSRDHPGREFSDLDGYVDAYTQDLYLCDRHYRKAILAFRTIRNHYPHYREVLENTVHNLVSEYPRKFVHPLNTAWQRSLQSEPSQSQALRTEPLHTFYDTFLGDDAPKTAVIVSDGLRYEVAAELSDRLRQDKRKESELGTLLAPIPSITSLGKASLLPNETIHHNGGQFFVDGQPTQGTRSREKVLQAVRQDARATRFEDIRKLTLSEGRQLFKDHPLVYIYHDRIDRYGDKAETEEETPTAVARTVDELESFVQTLNNWNVYRVVITADHGFLYSDEITDGMVQDMPATVAADNDDSLIECNRSVAAPDVHEEHGYRFPIRDVSNVDSDWTVAVPRAVNRYKKSGAGKRYAHGGASLQELIVPVLEVRKGRKDKAEKVDVRLVSKRNVITSGVLKVQITQTTSVSNKRRSRTLEVGLYDDQEELVSTQEKLVFDATSPDPTERTQSLVLELQPAANDLTSCRLRAFDSDDVNKINPVIDQRFKIQRLFDQDGF
jgi:uncharacterized protein (TIGR02687 family)